MTRFGLVIWVLAETADTTAYSLLLVASFLPIGLGGIIAGPLTDRRDRRVIMIVGNACASLSTLVVAGLWFTDVLEIWHLYIALFANGIANSFVIPAFDASVPLLVRKEQLGRAAGMSQTIAALEMIAGPALAGILLGTVGLGIIFIVDFVTFGAVVLALGIAVIPRPPKTESAAAEIGLRNELKSGWKYLNTRPPLRNLLIVVTVAMLFMPGFGFALCTQLVLSFADEQAAGLVLASFGFGAFAAGILLAAWGGPKQRMHGVLAGLLAASFSMMVIGIQENVLITALGVACIGMSFTMMMGLSRVIWQVKVAPSFMGRLFSIRLMFGVAAQCSGLLLAAPIAEGFFEPLMADDGELSGSLGVLLGTGPGRGMGLMYETIGVIVLVLTLLALISTNVRSLEKNLPDQITDGVANANSQ